MIILWTLSRAIAADLAVGDDVCIVSMGWNSVVTTCGILETVGRENSKVRWNACSTCDPWVATSTLFGSEAEAGAEAGRRNSNRKVAEAARASAAATALTATEIAGTIKASTPIKACFTAFKEMGGTLPQEVKIKITIQADGHVSSARIPSLGFAADGSLAPCLTDAANGLKFRAFSGSPVTLTYPFKVPGG